MEQGIRPETCRMELGITRDVRAGDPEPTGDEIRNGTVVYQGQGWDKSWALKCHEPNFPDTPETPAEWGLGPPLNSHRMTLSKPLTLGPLGFSCNSPLLQLWRGALMRNACERESVEYLPPHQ